MNSTAVISPTTFDRNALTPLPKVCILGDSGTGKTTALKTLVKAGITPFVIFMEQGMETMMDLPKGSFHYKYIRPTVDSWASIKDMSKKIRDFSYENITKNVDSNKSKFNGFMDLISTCNDFLCDCCKKSWGDVEMWNTDRYLCFDGMSGLSELAKMNVVGSKPTMSQPEWGLAQNQVRMILSPCVNLKAGFCLITHTERERDEITGGSIITVKTLGQKLAPDIPRMFSDVILAVRNGTDYTWDTAAANTATKSRNLPIAAKQPPSFVPLIENWKKNGGIIVPTP